MYRRKERIVGNLMMVGQPEPATEPAKGIHSSFERNGKSHDLWNPQNATIYTSTT
jgi:hypothetical protein